VSSIKFAKRKKKGGGGKGREDSFFLFLCEGKSLKKKGKGMRKDTGSRLTCCQKKGGLMLLTKWRREWKKSIRIPSNSCKRIGRRPKSERKNIGKNDKCLHSSNKRGKGDIYHTAAVPKKKKRGGGGARLPSNNQKSEWVGGKG